LVCVYVVLCLGRGLATSPLFVQGVLPSVKMIMKLKKIRGQGPSRAIEPVGVRELVSLPEFNIDVATVCIMWTSLKRAQGQGNMIKTQF
jgi:hypothetical protein